MKKNALEKLEVGKDVEIPPRADLFLKLIHATYEGENRLINFLKHPHKHEIQQPPLSVELLAPIYCQQNCFYCSAGFVREVDGKFYNEKTTLPVTLEKRSKLTRVLDVLDELAELRTKGAVWTGGGDWTVYPWFPSVLARAKQHNISSMWITHLASKEYSSDELSIIIESCDSIRVSLDGHNQQLYNKIRKPKNTNAFNIMIRNISGLVNARKNQSSKCHIGVQMVLCNQNLEVIPEIIELAESLKVDYIQIRPIELRGSHSSKIDPEVKDVELQEYKSIYDLEQLKYADKICSDLTEKCSIEIIYRKDKVNNITKNTFKEQIGRKTQRCAGAHFQTVVSFNNLLKPMIRHCYFRHDLESAPFEKGELMDVLYSKSRSQMFRAADTSPLKCSSGCKYVDCNKRVEALVLKPLDEALKEVALLSAKKVNLINPDII